MATAKRKRRKIPELHGSEFVGMRVAVAFNLHKARSTEPKPGEFIYTVREKAGGKVLAHVDEIALVDVTPKILPGSLRRIKERKVREVCCYLTGTVVRPAEVPKRGRKAISFNPFKADCFTVASSRCVQAAEYVIFTEGRKTLGVRVQLEPKRRSEISGALRRKGEQGARAYHRYPRGTPEHKSGRKMLVEALTAVGLDALANNMAQEAVRDFGVDFDTAIRMGIARAAEITKAGDTTRKPKPKRKRKPKLSEAEKAANTRKMVNQIALGGLRL